MKLGIFKKATLNLMRDVSRPILYFVTRIHLAKTYNSDFNFLSYCCNFNVIILNEKPIWKYLCIDKLQIELPCCDEEVWNWNRNPITMTTVFSDIELQLSFRSIFCVIRAHIFENSGVDYEYFASIKSQRILPTLNRNYTSSCAFYRNLK